MDKLKEYATLWWRGIISVVSGAILGLLGWTLLQVVALREANVELKTSKMDRDAFEVYMEKRRLLVDAQVNKIDAVQREIIAGQFKQEIYLGSISNMISRLERKLEEHDRQP